MRQIKSARLIASGRCPATLWACLGTVGGQWDPAKGNVKTLPTDVLIDKAAEKLYPTWRQNFEEWEKTGSDRGYHYLGSAIWFNRIGKAMGEAMLEMPPGK